MVTAPYFVVFCAHASGETGAGHIMRCLTLADALEAQGHTCAFAVGNRTLEIAPLLQDRPYPLLIGSDVIGPNPREMQTRWPRGADLVVIDDYARDTAFEIACRDFAARIMCFDDTADRPHACEILLNQGAWHNAADYRTLVPDGCRVLVGTDYALLRPQFAKAREAALARREGRKGRINRILISLGGGDTAFHLTQIISALSVLSGRNMAVDLVLGSKNEDKTILEQRLSNMAIASNIYYRVVEMAALMARSDLVIGAGGISSWERCCLGLPCMLVITSDDQTSNAKALVREGAAHLLDWKQAPDIETARKALLSLIDEPAVVYRMALNSARLCDGLGAKRVVHEVLEQLP